MFNWFERQIHKMVKHTQAIRRQIADELSVFDHYVGLALKGLTGLKGFGSWDRILSQPIEV